jgi:hypothetical protein
VAYIFHGSNTVGQWDTVKESDMYFYGSEIVGQWDTLKESDMYLSCHRDGGTVEHNKRE